MIDGKLEGAAGGRAYPNINPATEQQIGVAADASAADVERAIVAARRAFDETDWWSDHARRAACLRQLHDALVGSMEDLRAMTVAEVGAPVALTHGPQLATPIGFLTYYADLLDQYEWSHDLGVADSFGVLSHRWTEREAIGVVAAITPWNFPTQINLAKLAPALAAGCTVILKAAPDTPWSAAVLGRLIAEQTDIPPGVVNVITSAQKDIGALLTNDPRVDMVSFTGSTATGREIMRACAATVKKVFLELGGKSASIVLDDADFGAAAGACAFQVCVHAGQGCAITSRLLLPRSRYEAGVEIAADVLARMPYGDPTNPEHLMGPLVSAAQRDRVERYVSIAVDEGARVVVGGRRPAHLTSGYYYEPTLLADVEADATVAQDEIFGPVLVAVPFDDDDDAVRIANHSIYGLSGAVHAGTRARALAVARRIRTGTITVNGGSYYGADVPFGGYKQSGIGREMGVAGFEEYLQTKSLAEPAKSLGEPAPDAG
ncbi:MAG TPA: aldehyde dehydrogenase family protein [Acidimicrobiales bacterium]|nr:aldehyde dehydrogenase family protein [Acidimicrobiales bacterium]